MFDVKKEFSEAAKRCEAYEIKHVMVAEWKLIPTGLQLCLHKDGLQFFRPVLFEEIEELRDKALEFYEKKSLNQFFKTLKLEGNDV